MGTQPCSDKIGSIKRGPWTPEEDITLVSYIQELGHANWSIVPCNTGLLRCAKSCRLRWTNYLRPGIKRGNFTEHEEKIIIHLQALLGNRWAAIASYLPMRTDNDIKNYWNTHLRKKLRKLSQVHDGEENENHDSTTKGQWERRLQTDDIHKAKQALFDALSLDKSNVNSSIDYSMLFPKADHASQHNKLCSPQSNSTTYASSTENIAHLLVNWMKGSPNYYSSESSTSTKSSTSHVNNNKNSDASHSVSAEDEAMFGSGINSENQMAFSLTEKWLLDCDAAHELREGDFFGMNMIGGTSGLL